MAQTVHVVSTSYRMPNKPVYTVLVMPKNRNVDGTYYRINGIALDLLHRGWTPEKIGLEPLDEEERYEDD